MHRREINSITNTPYPIPGGARRCGTGQWELDECQCRQWELDDASAASAAASKPDDAIAASAAAAAAAAASKPDDAVLGMRLAGGLLVFRCSGRVAGVVSKLGFNCYTKPDEQAYYKNTDAV